MKCAEVIFEPGSKSVVSYNDENELRGFLQEHHRRAINGEPGGPTGHPAERITRVLLYDQHPANYLAGGKVDADKLSSLINGMTSDNSVDAQQLTEALRDEVSPVYPVDQGRHASMYKMPETSELDLSFLDDANTPERGEQGGAV